VTKNGILLEKNFVGKKNRKMIPIKKEKSSPVFKSVLRAERE
jgi:hypothetical protein